jgi:hypothetical protein
MPVYLAGVLVVLVVRIGGKLFLLPLPLAGALAILFIAILLVLYPGVSIDKTSAINASDLGSHGSPPGEEEHKPIQIRCRTRNSRRI